MAKEHVENAFMSEKEYLVKKRIWLRMIKMSKQKKIGIIICDRYRDCAGVNVLEP